MLLLKLMGAELCLAKVDDTVDKLIMKFQFERAYGLQKMGGNIHWQTNRVHEDLAKFQLSSRRRWFVNSGRAPL